ncbi:two-partner secretion domain-containing protein [Leptothoe spongobia]|uniref:Filamentous hemagglutinin N-terminal domain-containing protein n=1 Tax=Leptothoe spongobia TAU-MAC 1115 TaxID=1967444 RepID=A0A947DFS8_9CYAN|nr:filamentous hemagglutinin N-terminal domain-containing protein [Leptothoe spongobia]MBT9315768.1 filamentous hemagglutinin N-terminal domain-containing protein [Leptothoe spongobia TAU-MAC 1115]
MDRYLTNILTTGVTGAITLVAGFWPSVAHGQLLLPDDSLGATPSTVTVTPNARRFLIEGGVARGSTLFHSFRDFNIAPNTGVYFINPAITEQIVARVTGDLPSNLLGTFGVLGDADMVFINPNGIVFGPRSRLDMGGSFLASTAEAVVFGDEFTFSATTLDTPPLLTVNVPSGLQFGQQPGPILYQAVGGIPNRGLTVQPGETLALLGGALNLENARLEAIRGQIELGSIAEAGQVAIVPREIGWAFDYSDIQVFDNLLSSRSIIRTAATENDFVMPEDDQGGNILIQAADVNLTRSTQVRAGTLTNLSSGDITINAQRLMMDDGSFLTTRAVANSSENITGNAGNISINASESVVLQGATETPTRIDATVQGETVNANNGLTKGVAFGNGGNIFINTPQLSVIGGAQVGTVSSTAGNAGNITINAPESIEISGVSQSRNNIRRSTIATGSSRSGTGGDLIINTGDLRISNGGRLKVGTAGTGAGGRTIINADTVGVIGGAAVPGSETLLSAIFARTGDEGNAGTVWIDARAIELRDGGRISTTALPNSRGNSNSIRINTTESIEIDGGIITENSFNPSGIFSNTQGTGRAGALDITTNELKIGNGGKITASTLNRAAQTSGGLDLSVNRLLLDGGAQIIVGTRADEGTGATVLVSDFEVILLRNGSLITSEALNSANGGNVIFSSSEGFVIAPPGEDSDIVARSNLGDGGRIDIVAQSILGLEERLALPNNGTNDLDASSRFGKAGTVSLNELGTEPIQAGANLPEAIGADEISRQCQPRSGISSFVVSGQGGIPTEVSMPGLLWETLDNINTREMATEITLDPVDSSLLTESPLREAQDWHMSGAGQIVLVAHTAETIPYATTSLAHCFLGDSAL